jgi:hypothetical protein
VSVTPTLRRLVQTIERLSWWWTKRQERSARGSDLSSTCAVVVSDDEAVLMAGRSGIDLSSQTEWVGPSYDCEDRRRCTYRDELFLDLGS